jgi:hypothetical protein
MKTNHLNQMQFKYMFENEQCPIYYFYNHLSLQSTLLSLNRLGNQHGNDATDLRVLTKVYSELIGDKFSRKTSTQPV